MPQRPGPFYEVDIPQGQHRDSRAATQSQKRGRDQYHKYIKYTNVTRRQVNAAHYQSNPEEGPFGWSLWPALIEECAVVERVPKRGFYNMALAAKRCRHHGPCPAKKMKNQKKWVEMKRGSKFAREQARRWTQCTLDILALNQDRYPDINWLPGGCDDDLICLDGWCTDPEGTRISMADIIASHDASFVIKNNIGAADETDSNVSAYTEDWSDIESLASWADYVEVVPLEGCFGGEESDWSEVN